MVRRYIGVFLFLLVLCTILPKVSFAATSPSYATCDMCGYCPPSPPPTNWKNCVECLYPNITPDPSTKDTLKIDPKTNLPPAIAKGRQYTIIGCIKTDLGSFSNEGAAQSLVSVLLSLIFEIVGGVAFLYLLYGSFLITTSQADEQRLSKGKNIVHSAIIGLVFSLLSVFIIKILAANILKIPGFG